MFEIGSSLREARLRRHLELEEVATQTMIPGRYLAAIEDERFDVLPEGLYRRSFLREYADFLGLEGGLYADEYVSRYEPEEPEQPVVPPRLPTQLPLSSRVGVKIGVGLVGAIVLGFAVWGLGGTESKRSGLQPLGGAPARAPYKPPARQHTTPPVEQRVRPSNLVLIASRGRCWLSVRFGSRDGQLVYEGTLEPGQSVRFGLRRALWIRLGAPPNLDASIGGKPVTNLPQKVSNVFVTRAGVQSA